MSKKREWRATKIGRQQVIVNEGGGRITYIDGDCAHGDLLARAPTLLAERDTLAASLRDALRYIEVKIAYHGAMTAAEVEAAIVANRCLSETQIGANSCSMLAHFNIDAARAALAKVTP